MVSAYRGSLKHLEVWTCPVMLAKFRAALIFCMVVAAFATPGWGQSVTGTIPVGVSPKFVGLNPITNQIYVTNQGSNTVTAVNGATHATVAVPVDNVPASVAVNPATNSI
jgi:YVTN family beta-propeller protein